jgi:acyl-CoA thioesterase I
VPALVLALAACTGAASSPSRAPALTVEPASPASSGGAAPALRYVALGDSYTIGTSVTAAERWPNQLVAQVGELELVANPAVNGFTSHDLIAVQLPLLPALRPDFVSVLIGVNDVVQGVPEATYRSNVTRILDELVRLVGATRIVVVTTPDYTVTPAGADYGDPTTQSAGIRRNNAIITELARARGIAIVDIYDISLEAATDRSLVASDGLHPSGAQYARWVERMIPVVRGLSGA